MNKLKIKSCQTKTCTNAIWVQLDSTLDETFYSHIEPFWSLLSKDSSRLVIFDFEMLTSWTPLGLGFFLGMSKSLFHQTRAIWFSHSSPEFIQAILAFDAAFFTRVHQATTEDIQDIRSLSLHIPVDHFSLSVQESELKSGQAFTLRIEAKDHQSRIIPDYTGIPHLMIDRGMISPTLITEMKNGFWEGQTVISGSGPINLRIWDDAIEGTLTLNLTEIGSPVTFPITVECPGCHKQNVVSKADVSRCMKCNHIYFVDPQGHLIPLKPGIQPLGDFVRHLTFNIPSDINYLNLVRNFIVGVAHEENVDEEQVSQIEMAMDEALANVVEHAYAYDSFQEVHISICLYQDAMEIIITDHGRSFDSQKTPLPNLKEHIEQRRVGGLGRYLMKTLMDEVHYQRHHHTNELRMLKRFNSRSAS